jgi:PAS domain S-box-containing protein
MYQEKDQYRLLIENLPDGLAYCKMVLDNTGKPLDYIFLEVNSSFEALAGLPRDHIIGKKLTEVRPGIEGLSFDWIGVFGKVAATGKSTRLQQYLKQQDRWYEVTAYSDQPGYFAVVFHDITERKRAEEELRKSHERFQLANRATFNVIWDWNLQTDALWRNENFQVLFGYRAEEIEPGIESWTNRIHPEDVDRVKVSIHTAIDSGQQSWSDHYRFRRKDGVYAEVEDRGYISREANGTPVRMIGAMQDITERKQAELLILVQRDLALAISFSHQLDEALLKCLDTMLQLSEMECGGIYLIDQASGDLNLICHRNLSPAFIKSVSHYKADSTRARLVLQGKSIFTRYSGVDLPLSEVEKAEKLKAFAVLPLIFEKRVIGCLNLASQKLEDVSEINRQVLKTAATLMGEGITRLKIEEKLKLTNQKLHKAMKSTIQAIALILEKRDPYTAGHQKRMTKLACAIGEEISLSPDKIGGIYIAGIIHDIGKINVPTEILNKPGRLSEIELSLIKTHPQVGSDILKEMELPGGVSSIVLQHHERMDGSGYPSGLSGKDIILEARILAVADVVEAMASHRPYRPALGLDKALEEITKNKGKLYDPQVVDACWKLFKEKGFKF